MRFDIAAAVQDIYDFHMAVTITKEDHISAF